MRQTTTILAELKDFMKRENLNINQLGKLTGLNSGSLSSIINGKKVMSVEQLDRLTASFGRSEGDLYEQYLQDYLIPSPPNWRRIRPFFYRCEELNKLDCIRKTVDLLLDNLLYSSVLFEAAEDFFKSSKYAAAAILYEGIAESEQKQHSERLAVCQYRLFTIRQGTDQELNYQAAIQFEPYVERLDEMDQLDALKDLVNAYRALNRWDKVEKMIQMMEHKAKIFYFSERQRVDSLKKTKRPLFFYLAYSYLLRGNICDLRRDYEQALRYIQLYADLSWVKETDQETQHWKNLFQEWSHANYLLTKISSGDTSVLSEYVAYIEPKKDEIVLSLLNIMEAANRFSIDVDDILQRFEVEIRSITKKIEALGVYTQQMIMDNISRLLNELADYYLHKGKYLDGFKYLIDSLEICSKINNKACIIKCVGLFEVFRDYATSETNSTYKILINEVYEDEKKMGVTPLVK
ncbi:XRE family transcriptional regulator [Paenibacillus oralis]|uniref:XRE family transcriptional regulator n=1 Tax=Paenibacillus oralis TaxID=2490856 RepID=A0A3P3U9L3_9BACL|nr:helix-turn-helix domain-containing protein [Paenibacillus oralis]RRJ66844.1 XRE family transcriptional regulator [Paenibacillus oralis]